MPPPQQKLSQRTTSTPEEQQVASARKEVELEEGDLEDLQSSKEAQVTEQQMRTQMEEDTHTFPQDTPAISHQQEDLGQEDLPAQRDPIGFNWPGGEDVEGDRQTSCCCWWSLGGAQTVIFEFAGHFDDLSVSCE